MSLRYAILHHTGVDEPHFDLMFETFPGSDLATWRAPVWPIESGCAAKRLKDHRAVYLDFEGELSNRRGRVERVTGGACEVEVGPDGVWTVRLLSGTSPTGLRARPADDGWTIEPLA